MNIAKKTKCIVLTIATIVICFSMSQITLGIENKLKLLGVIAVDKKLGGNASGVASIYNVVTQKTNTVRTGEIIKLNSTERPLLITKITQEGVTLVDPNKITYHLPFEGFQKRDVASTAILETDYDTLEDDTQRILDILQKAREESLSTGESSEQTIIWPPEEVREIIYCENSSDCYVPND